MLEAFGDRQAPPLGEAGIDAEETRVVGLPHLCVGKIGNDDDLAIEVAIGPQFRHEIGDEPADLTDEDEMRHLGGAMFRDERLPNLGHKPMVLADR